MENTFYMSEVLALAKKGSGFTAPNPMVGSIIVKNNIIVGKGFHKNHGGPHAEINAIEDAKLKGHKELNGSVLYCNLEPCCFYSKTKHNKPCVERIIKEKISLVIIAQKDPNPRVNGKGIKILEKAGIKVITGINEKKARKINKIYNHFYETGLPYIHLKTAQTLDGRIAGNDGDSFWITSRNARKEGHKLRAAYQSILAGTNTIKKDNPSLTVRYVKGRNPIRIIFDRMLTIPQDANVFSECEKGYLFYNSILNKEKEESIKKLETRGIKCKKVSGKTSELMNIHEIIKYLAGQNIHSILLEGGSGIYTSFLLEKLVNSVSFFIAPKIIGKGKETIGQLGILTPAESIKLKSVKYTQIENQILVQGDII